MLVRRATPADEHIVRGLRLQALADAESAFDSTLANEGAWTSKEWQAWLARGTYFLLEHDGEPKGIVAGVPHWTDPSSAFLVAMWVHPSLRGTGASDRLVRAILEWAEREGLSNMWLHVGKLNEHARRLYERCGFRATGEELTRELDGLVEVEMRCGIGSGTSD